MKMGTRSKKSKANKEMAAQGAVGGEEELQMPTLEKERPVGENETLQLPAGRRLSEDAVESWLNNHNGVGNRHLEDAAHHIPRGAEALRGLSPQDLEEISLICQNSCQQLMADLHGTQRDLVETLQASQQHGQRTLEDVILQGMQRAVDAREAESSQQFGELKKIFVNIGRAQHTMFKEQLGSLLDGNVQLRRDVNADSGKILDWLQNGQQRVIELICDKHRELAVSLIEKHKITMDTLGAVAADIQGDMRRMNEQMVDSQRRIMEQCSQTRDEVADLSHRMERMMSSLAGQFEMMEVVAAQRFQDAQEQRRRTSPAPYKPLKIKVDETSDSAKPKRHSKHGKRRHKRKSSAEYDSSSSETTESDSESNGDDSSGDTDNDSATRNQEGGITAPREDGLAELGNIRRRASWPRMMGRKRDGAYGITGSRQHKQKIGQQRN